MMVLKMNAGMLQHADHTLALVTEVLIISQSSCVSCGGTLKRAMLMTSGAAVCADSPT